jgi:tetratricopeptide (TPR) repeat protein
MNIFGELMEERAGTSKPLSGMVRFLMLALSLLNITPLAAASSRAARQFSDPLVQNGFDHFYNVEYPEAIAVFKKAVEAAPNDPDRYNHLAEAVLFGMMHRVGALESQMVTGGNSFLRLPKMEPTAEEQALFAASIQKVMGLTGQALRKNPNDVDALYEQGVAIGFRSTYDYMVKKAWLDSLREATAARKLHNRVVELDPSRVDARMMQGLHDYLVGSLPLVYKMLGFLAGFRGDKEQGMRTLKLVAQKGVYNKVDAEILLGVIYRRERRPWEVIPTLESLHARFPRNFLVLFELSQMYADMGDRAKALAPLDQIEQLKQTGAPGFRTLPEARIQFARGNLLFWYKDFDAAIRELEQATAHAEVLDPNSGPSAWLRLGQCYDIRGRRANAVHCYQRAVAFTPASDPAKEARKYIDSAFSLQQMREIQRATKVQKP